MRLQRQTDRLATSVSDLRERLAGVERRGTAGGSVTTGWEAFDAALAGGGLGRGGVHEWVGLAPLATRAAIGNGRGRWSPPLGVMVHLAGRCRDVAGAKSEGLTVCWIGRRVWPSAHALSGEGAGGAGTLLQSSLLVDAPDAASRLWAADLAARCASVLVVVDGSGFDIAASRRLQLAAEAGGGAGGAGGWMVLVCRPAWEIKELSAATTRWLVERDVSAKGGVGAGGQRLRVHLIRSRGPGSVFTQDRMSVIQRASRDRYVTVPAEVAQRPVAPALAG